MKENYKKLTYNNFLKYIDKLSENLRSYINKNKIKIDYICPILRSGAVPAVYIANKLNIVKFLPIQVKHIKYKNGNSSINMIFNSLDAIQIKKKEPIFLLVDAICSTGTSAEICINEIKRKYKNAKILYVCLAKQYGSKGFKDSTIYEDFAFYYNEDNKLSEEKNIECYNPLFPWEILEAELEHPDDLEENIFF